MSADHKLSLQITFIFFLLTIFCLIPAAAGKYASAPLVEEAKRRVIGPSNYDCLKSEGAKLENSIINSPEINAVKHKIYTIYAAVIFSQICIAYLFSGYIVRFVKSKI